MTGRKKIAFDIFDLISFIVFALGIVLFIRFFLINPFTVMGQSMESTFSWGDFIFVNKVDTFFKKEIKRNDVVVVIPPHIQRAPYIKRVIGMPGETVELKEWKVFITPVEWAPYELNEPYLDDGTVTNNNACKLTTFEIPADEYFVLGDNREHSTDSRCCFWYWCFGDLKYSVSQEYIVWVVAARLFPAFRIY